MTCTKNHYSRYFSLFYWVVVSGFILGILVGCKQLSLNSDRSAASSEKNYPVAISQMQLGLAYLAQDQKPRAKQKLLKALDLAPQCPEVNAAMAYFWEMTGEPALARKLYKKSLSLDPHHGAPCNNYAAFLCRQKDYAGAEKYFLQAVSDPKYINSAIAYENAGICMEQAKNFQKAIYYYEKALQQDSSRKLALKALVRLQLRFNQPKRALLWIQRYNLQIVNDPELLTIAREVARKTHYAQLGSDYYEL